MKKTGSDSAYFIWSASILICVLLAVFALFFASCNAAEGETAAKAPAAGSAAPEESPEASEEPPPTVPVLPPSDATQLAESIDMGAAYIDSFYFLGDAASSALADYGLVDRSRVWASTDGTLSLEEWSTNLVHDNASAKDVTISDAVSSAVPEYLLITLGVSGASLTTQDNFAANYKSLIEGIKMASPNTKIILNSVYPITEEYAQSDAGYGITNAKLDVVNSWIKQVAEDSGVKFIDCASVLRDDGGALSTLYHDSGSVTPNAAGCAQIINYIRTHGYA